MKDQYQIFREIYSESKEPNSSLKFMDAVEKFQNTYKIKAPYKNLQSFKSSISQKVKKIN